MPRKPGALRPSFKLTDLTAANGLMHEAAHDALSSNHQREGSGLD